MGRRRRCEARRVVGDWVVEDEGETVEELVTVAAGLEGGRKSVSWAVEEWKGERERNIHRIWVDSLLVARAIGGASLAIAKLCLCRARAAVMVVRRVSQAEHTGFALSVFCS